MQSAFAFYLVLHVLLHVSTAVPVSSRSSRMVREVYPELSSSTDNVEGNLQQPQVCVVGDVVYSAEEPVPAEQPCLKCVCRPPGVHCEATRCHKRPGCKAIHRPNSCCPEYQCECEHEGKIYANGERLQTAPGGECKVCYCRGGEVQCAEVGCYIRTDCEPRTVPGQCCPKYDHCPPKEPSVGHELIKQSIKPSSSNSSIIIPLIEVSTLSVLKEFQAASSAIPDNPTSSNDVETYTDDAIAESLLVVPLKQNDPKPSANPDELSMERNDETSKITIHEVIPNTKVEYPMTDSKKDKINRSDEVKIAERVIDVVENIRQLKDNGITISSVDAVTLQKTGEFNNAIGDSDGDHSEVSEVYHPTPVLRIGDQLLFLKKGELVPEKDVSTPIPVITIIGAEGLQRGTEDSAESNDPKIEIIHSDGTQKIDDDTDDIEEDSDDARGSESTHVVSFVRPNSPATTETPRKDIRSTRAPISDQEEFEELIKDLESTSNPPRRSGFQVPKIIHESLKNVAKIRSSSSEPGTGVVLKEFRSDFYNFTEGSANGDEAEFGSTDSGAEASENIEVKLHPTASVNVQFGDDTTSENYVSTTEASILIITGNLNGTANTNTTDDDEKLETAHETNPEYPVLPEEMDSVPAVEDFSEVGSISKITTESSSSTVNPTEESVTSTEKAVEQKIIQEILVGRLSSTSAASETTLAPEDWLKNGTDAVDDREAMELVETSTDASSTTTTESTSETGSTPESESSRLVLLEDDMMNSTVDSLTALDNETEIRSTESLEETQSDESTEMTTLRGDMHASVLSDENASVEEEGGTLNTDDLVEMVPGFEATTPEGEVTSSDNEVDLHDDSTTTQEPRNREAHKDDVEVIEPLSVKHQFEEAEGKHVVSKKELKKVDAMNVTAVSSPADESKDAIEPSTVRPQETEVLRKVSDAIARFQLRETTESLDTSVISILKDFFKTQFKYSDRK